jgi:hypothetical protein
MPKFLKHVLLISVGVPTLMVSIFGPIFVYVTYVPRVIYGSEGIGLLAFVCFGFFWLGIVFATLVWLFDEKLNA